MSTDTSKFRNKIAKLNKSLDELESKLEPLLVQPLDETVLGLDAIQQAKLLVIVPYVVYDLMFVYLKARGIDPMTHPVIAELDRMRQYFEKIQRAEESGQKRRLTIDKKAAERFVKHAITQAKNVQLVDETERDAVSSTAGPNTSAERAPIKTTAKMYQRAEYEKNLKEIADEEEDDLEVFGENVEEDYPMDELPPDVSPGMEDEDEGREEQVVDAPGSRRKRPRIDPFTGYDDISIAERSTPASSAPDKSQSSKSFKKKSRRKTKK